MLKIQFLKVLLILNAMKVFSLSDFYNVIKTHQQVLAEIIKKWVVNNIILSMFFKGKGLI